MKIDTLKDNFVAGEIAPALFGRTDIEQYENACSIVENFLIRPYGPLISTPGTEFINDAKYDTVAGGNDENTILLLHFNGADASTTFTDSSTGGIDSPHTVTPTGNTQMDTAQSVFGGASGLFDGNGDYLSIPDSTDFYIDPDEELTIDFWVRWNVLPTLGVDATSQFIFRYGTIVPGNIWHIAVDGLGAGNTKYRIIVGIYGGGGGQNLGTSTALDLVTDRWYHIAFTKPKSPDLNECKLYLDGMEISSGIVASTYWVDIAQDIRIGSRDDNAYYFNGWLDEFRISNVVRWTTDFTVPDSEYSDSALGGDGVSTRIYGRARLIPFIFARDDAYVIEVGSGYFRFYTDGAVVTT